MFFRFLFLLFFIIFMWESGVHVSSGAYRLRGQRQETSPSGVIGEPPRVASGSELRSPGRAVYTFQYRASPVPSHCIFWDRVSEPRAHWVVGWLVCLSVCALPSARIKSFHTAIMNTGLHEFTGNILQTEPSLPLPQLSVSYRRRKG